VAELRVTDDASGAADYLQRTRGRSGPGSDVLLRLTLLRRDVSAAFFGG
jgi:hypothetical protein